MNPIDPVSYRTLGGPVASASSGIRVDLYLSREYPFLSRALWQKRLKDGEVLINGRVVRSSHTLKEHDVVHMYHVIEDEPEVNEEVEFLWEEGGILAVMKPAPLPMHENGPYRKKTLAKIVQDRFGLEWAAVHRLDRETSGIVLCAATPEIRRKLSEAFEEHRVQKEYTAIACGVAAERSWICEAPIGAASDSKIRIKKWVNFEDGLSARTDFVVRGCKDEKWTLLHAMPKTGRTNQIRVHAAFSGLPLLGDKMYHGNEEVFLKFYASGNTDEVKSMAGFPRHCLHASMIEFKHPENGRNCLIQSPMAPDMKNFWELP